MFITFGTSWIGRHHLFTKYGTCQRCGSRGLLRSSDATLSLSVMFIPMLPLQKKRLLSECERCGNARAAIKPKDFKRQRAALARDIAVAVDNLDKAALLALLPRVAETEDQELLDELGPLLFKSWSEDREMMQVLGWTAEQLELPSLALSSWGRAVAICQNSLGLDHPHTTTSEVALAWVELRYGLIVEAERRIYRHLNQVHRYEFVCALSKAIAASGDIARGLALFDFFAQRFYPQLDAQDVAHQRAAVAAGGQDARKLCFVGPEHQAEFNKGRRTASRIVNGFGPMCVFLAMVALAGAGAHGFFNQRLEIINGTDRPYMVEIDEQRHVLSPGRTRISVAPGEHILKYEGAEIPFLVEREPAQVFASTVEILNPDREAILHYAYIPYATDPQFASGERHEILSGQLQYTLSPDYIFEVAPDTIEMDGNVAVIEQLTLISRERAKALSASASPGHS